MNPMIRLAPVLAMALLAACAEPSPPVSPGEAAGTADVAPASPPAADGGADAAAPAADAQARGQAAMKEFGDTLRTELRMAMGRDGADGAVAFCHDQAPVIAEQVMARHGVRLGRIAVPGRNRNPDNAPAGWQGEVLAGFQEAVDAGDAPEAQVALIRDALPDGVSLRMARGIRVEAACLMCHGDNIAPPIAERLAALYPDDRATGFLEGDLRGLVWVEVPGDKEPQP